MKTRIAAVMAGLVISAGFLFSQAGIYTKASGRVGVFSHLTRGPAEKMAGEVGIVNITARHCAKYLRDNGSVDEAACDADKSTIYATRTIHNSRTNAGRDWQYNQMGGTPGAACQYIATTNDGTDPAADGSNSNTTLAGELGGTTGLARALGTPSHSAGTNSYTIAKTFTAGATVPTSLQRAALFTASGGGTMCFESAKFSSITLSTTGSDTATINWQINY